MKHSEFQLGTEFQCAGQRWRCTDAGSRVIVAISLEPREVATLVAGQEHRYITDDPSWFDGPSYAVVERVFDEVDIPACTLGEVHERHRFGEPS